jgi:hypothetical protein
MKTLRKYVREILLETTNEDFLKDLKSLAGEWEKVQEEIPTKTETRPIYGTRWNPETEDIDQDFFDTEVTFQVTKDEKKRPYTEENPDHYDEEHPAERRVKYGQTLSEIEIERKLMSLWQKYADIGFFKSDALTYSHNFRYPSAARMMGKGKVKRIENYSPSLLIDAQDQPQKDAISVAAKYSPGNWPAIQGQIGNGWGIVIRGHPIFASFEDVASQTQRMASDQTREFYKSSGLPKRAGMERVSQTELSPRRERMMKKIAKRYEDPDLYMKSVANPIVLDEEDIKSRYQKGSKHYGTNMLEEVILDNWKIAGWYISSNNFPEANRFFIRAIEKGLITKPIFLLDDEGERELNPKDSEQMKNFVKYLKVKER